MLVQMMLLPVGIAKTLRKKVVLLLPAVGAAVAVCLRKPVYAAALEGRERENDGTASLVILGLASLFALVLYLLVLVTQVVLRLEQNFVPKPWRVKEKECSYSINACPFYAPAEAMYYCTVCKSNVSSMAWHTPSMWMKFPIGDVMLDWNKAEEAVKMVDDPTNGRIQLDEALDFRGSIVLDEVEECCIGCFVQTRNFNCITRMAFICNLISMFAALVPWAINALEPTLQNSISIAVAVISMFYGMSAVAVYVQGMASVLCFLEDHGHSISFSDVSKIPPWLTWVCRLLE